MTDQPKPRAYRLADYDDALIRIGELRETRGLSLGDLGDVVGVTRQRIGDWMRAEHEPRARQLFELFAALGYDLALIPKDTP